MKKSKIATLLIIALIVTLIIGGIVMTVQNQNLFTDGVKREKKGTNTMGSDRKWNTARRR